MVEYIKNSLITKSRLTQNEVILLHLIKNGYITNKQASNNYGFHYLPSIIRDLKKEYGCKFDNVKQKEMFNRYSQKVEFDEYHLINRKEIEERLGK